ncbi:12 kDa heat shock protein [Kluyveromyces marxianus]
MSDAGRKDFGDKVSEAVKPDSQKSTLEKGKEVVTDQADKLAGKLQPEENKGVGQTVHDSAQQGKDDAKGKSLGETAQEYVEEAKHKLGEAAEYISKQVNGGEKK